MFVLKKNSYLAKLISEFLFYDVFINAVIFVVYLVVLFLASFNQGDFSLSSVAGMVFYRILGFIVYCGYFFIVFRVNAKRRFCPKVLLNLNVAAHTCHIVMVEIVISRFVRYAGVCLQEKGYTQSSLSSLAAFIDFAGEALGWVAVLIVVSLVFEFILAFVPVFYAAAGGIVSFYLSVGGKKPACNLSNAIDGKTGVKIVSGFPKYSKTVDVAAGYFSIDADDSLIVAEPGCIITRIPKEDVKCVVFTALSGKKTKVCYKKGKWRLV